LDAFLEEGLEYFGQSGGMGAIFKSSYLIFIIAVPGWQRDTIFCGAPKFNLVERMWLSVLSPAYEAESVDWH
jgi:hypothetical protein